LNFTRVVERKRIVELDLEAAAREHRLEIRLIDGLYVGVFRLDEPVLYEVKERVIEHYHSVVLAGLHRGWYLECFSFADQVADRGRYDKDLKGGNPAAALLRKKRLSDHAF